ncbi:Transposase IS1201 [Lactobacillus helveticus CIRM-BIA 104]|uniref:Transposase IS1201 n=1 Tax=Lactobacillus helveticus CIRM-BIA 104 TaxID=1226333 RepID=U6FBY9_LACHE|nr:Transposase IS1201 [Lactobacillus helveticus CIRM-BIA 104]
MNDFTKNMAQALFNQDKINDLLRKELQQAVNDLLEAELTAFLGYDPYAKSWLEYRQFTQWCLLSQG